MVVCMRIAVQARGHVLGLSFISPSLTFAHFHPFHTKRADHEPIRDLSLIPGIRIENLVKRYKRKAPPAVNNLNLTLYESQITALLGHNGAG